MVTTAEKNALNGYWETSREFLIDSGNQQPTDEQIRSGALLIQRRDLNRNRSRSSSLVSSLSSASEHHTPDTSFEIVPEQSEKQATELSYQEFRSLALASPFSESDLSKFLGQFKYSDFHAIYTEHTKFPLFSWIIEELKYPVFRHLTGKFYPIEIVLDLLQEIDPRGYNVLHCWANGITIQASNGLTPTSNDFSLLQEIKGLFISRSQFLTYQKMCSSQSDEQTPVDVLNEAYNIKESTYYNQFIELLTTQVVS